MSSENNINILPSQDSSKDENSSGGKKTSSNRPQEQALKCPRCDSANTKFCYYNNYSLSQPRHFCKTCRRYWTKGGALRNVPIGGGCRKSKKVMKSASSRFSVGDSRESSSSSDQLGGFKFFQGFSPATDFQLGGISLPRLQPSIGGIYNQFSATLGDISTATSAAAATSSCFSLDPSGSSVSLMGFNNSQFGHPSASASSGLTGAIHDMGSMSLHSNIASSIESLSSMNQDLHWKLQQQRIAMLCGGENSQKERIPSSSVPMESQAQKPQALFFQNLDISGQQACGVDNNARKEDLSMPTEWFFGNSNSYAPVVNQNSTSSGGGNNTSRTNWNGVQAWGDLQQYSNLP